MKLASQVVLQSGHSFSAVNFAKHIGKDFGRASAYGSLPLPVLVKRNLRICQPAAAFFLYLITEIKAFPPYAKIGKAVVPTTAIMDDPVMEDDPKFVAYRSVICVCLVGVNPAHFSISESISRFASSA